jgi:FSR family fosmidomycin resistance protein-like MFS transporter
MTDIANPLGRDLKVMGLVGAAHGSSHFLQLALPPLFPLLRAEFDVSWAMLGLLPSLLYGVSGFGQAAAGFVVDRFGARRVLLAGLTLFSLATIAAGLVAEFWMLFPIAVIAGIGNCVFHPADLSILSTKVSKGRLGRAYGSHALSGNIGWALAPVVTGGIALATDWRTALVVAGCIGLTVVGAFLAWGADLADDVDAQAKENSGGGAARAKPAIELGRDIRALFSPTILSCFLYFAFLSAAIIGFQSFGVTALEQIYGISLLTATTAVTTFLIASAGGILIGGFAADRTDRHDVLAMTGVGAAACLLCWIGTGTPPAVLLIPIVAVAGFASGTTSPSRDMLVRKATPEGATGRVFGFVYSGLDLGSAAMPAILGIVVDHGWPNGVFYALAGVLVLTMATVVQVRRQARPMARPA